MSALKVIKSIKEFQEYRRSLPNDTRVGFVPTMGYLHEGHISLVSLAKKGPNFVPKIFKYLKNVKIFANNPNNFINYSTEILMFFGTYLILKQKKPNFSILICD